MSNLYHKIKRGEVSVGDDVDIITNYGKEYTITIQAFELSGGVYVIGKCGTNLCLVFNHPDSDVCAYVGFSKREFLSITGKWLTNEGF